MALQDAQLWARGSGTRQMQSLPCPLLSASSAHPSQERAAFIPKASTEYRWKLLRDSGERGVSPHHTKDWLQPVTRLAGSEYKLAEAGRGVSFSHTGSCPEFFSPSLILTVTTFLCKRGTSCCKKDFAPSPTSRQDCWVFSRSFCATSAPLEDIHHWVRVSLLPDHLQKTGIPDVFMRLKSPFCRVIIPMYGEPRVVPAHLNQSV